ncbi:hypothetical protein [Thalassobacillus hwangdonensis]|uniref:Resolvase HTH domain-containing protein n=1 Tax=Thalassobacillus hwangdonensis TaxID=546108 RepID=A0ABW3L2A5_9BACI
MLTIIITTGTIGAVLFILSFFMNDRFKELEEQLEQQTISSMQDSYQIKQKIKVLEEELLAPDITEELLPAGNSPRMTGGTPLVSKVKRLHNDGYNAKEIAHRTELKEHDVHSIIKHFN